MLARTVMAWWLILIRAGPSEPTGFESAIAWRAWSQHTTEMCFRFRPMLSSVVAGGCRKPISEQGPREVDAGNAWLHPEGRHDTHRCLMVRPR